MENNDFVADLLFKSREPDSKPLFKSKTEFFEKVVTTPGHEFFVDSKEWEMIKKGINRFHVRWHALTIGKRKNRIDLDLEKAFLSVIGEELEKRNIPQEKALQALRQSGISSQPVVLPPRDTKATSNVESLLKKPNTIYIFCTELFVEILLHSEAPIGEMLLDSILLNQDPHIRLFLARDNLTLSFAESMEICLATILRDRNGIYKENEIAKDYCKLTREEKIKIAREILRKANEVGSGEETRQRLAIKTCEFPGLFSKPYMIINPNQGSTKACFFERTENGLALTEWEYGSVSLWLMYDRQFLKRMEGTKYMQDYRF